MAQLRMRWLRVPPKAYLLPDEWSMRTFESDFDIDSWVNICACGQLGISENDRKAYEYAILSEAAHGLVPERDLWFVCNEKFVPVATVAAFVNENNDAAGIGQIHMVSMLPQYRGQGLGKTMIAAAMVHLFGYGCKFAQLTTDDFRIPAICSYLDNGFYPVIGGGDISNDDAIDFVTRWDVIMNTLGREKKYLTI